MLHSRIITLTANAGGSAAGTVTVPPSRYAGVFYEFDPDDSTNITITNLGRTVATKSGAVNADGVLALLPTAELLVSEQIVVTLDGQTEATRTTLKIFLDY